MSREYTIDEVRDKFLLMVEAYVDYWDALEDKDCREKLQGLAFSILVILDGGSAELPAFLVSTDPHPDDRQFNIERGENYFPEAGLDNDIAGGLHEKFANRRNKR